MTYSISSREVIAALLKMFVPEDEDANEKKGKKKKKLEDLIGDLINRDRYKKLCENVAFVCNAGNDRSTSAPIYWYTGRMMYYYKERGMSFHPKLFVVKYSKKTGETFFRIMIGSMNFVNSKNKEFIMVEDVQAYSEEEKDNSCNKEWEEGNPLKKCLEELLFGKCDERGASPICCFDGFDGFDGLRAKKRLQGVIRELFDGLYFEKGALPEIWTFPESEKDKKFKDDVLKSCTKIMSPFLTRSLIKECKEQKCDIYTMESELQKRGFSKEPQEGKENDPYIFYVYAPDQKSEKKRFNHIKMYVREDEHKKEIYAGSVNLTKSALTNNKEILVKLKFKDDKDKESLINDVFKIKKSDENGYGFKKETYYLNGTTEKTEKDDEIMRGFKDFSIEISNALEIVEMTEDCLSCEWKDNGKKLKDLKMELTKLESKSEIAVEKISLAPSGYRKRTREIYSGGDRIRNSIEKWRNIEDIKCNNMFYFSFQYKLDGETKECTFSLPVTNSCEGDGEEVRYDERLFRFLITSKRHGLAYCILGGDDEESESAENETHHVRNYSPNFLCLEDMLDQYCRTKEMPDYTDMIKIMIELLNTFPKKKKRKYGIYNEKLLERMLNQVEKFKKETSAWKSGC